MRVPHVYGRASDVYAWQNNYLNNSKPKIGGGSKFYAYTIAGQTFIHSKIIN